MPSINENTKEFKQKINNGEIEHARSMLTKSEIAVNSSDIDAIVQYAINTNNSGILENIDVIGGYRYPNIADMVVISILKADNINFFTECLKFKFRGNDIQLSEPLMYNNAREILIKADAKNIILSEEIELSEDRKLSLFKQVLEYGGVKTMQALLKLVLFKKEYFNFDTIHKLLDFIIKYDMPQLIEQVAKNQDLLLDMLKISKYKGKLDKLNILIENSKVAYSIMTEAMKENKSDFAQELIDLSPVDQNPFVSVLDSDLTKWISTFPKNDIIKDYLPKKMHIFTGKDFEYGDIYTSKIKNIKAIGDGKKIISEDAIPLEKSNLVIINTHGNVQNRNQENETATSSQLFKDQKFLIDSIIAIQDKMKPSAYMISSCHSGSLFHDINRNIDKFPIGTTFFIRAGAKYPTEGTTFKLYGEVTSSTIINIIKKYQSCKEQDIPWSVYRQNIQEDAETQLFAKITENEKTGKKGLIAFKARAPKDGENIQKLATGEYLGTYARHDDPVHKKTNIVILSGDESLKGYSDYIKSIQELQGTKLNDYPNYQLKNLFTLRAKSIDETNYTWGNKIHAPEYSYKQRLQDLDLINKNNFIQNDIIRETEVDPIQECVFLSGVIDDFVA